MTPKEEVLTLMSNVLDRVEERDARFAVVATIGDLGELSVSIVGSATVEEAQIALREIEQGFALGVADTTKPEVTIQ